MRPISIIAALIAFSSTGYAAEIYKDIIVEVTPTDDGVQIQCEIEYPEGTQHSSMATNKLKGQCGDFIDERILDKDQRYNGREVIVKPPQISLNDGKNRFEYTIRFNYFDYKATSNNPLEDDG